MNKTILNYINQCEAWKVEIKGIHWDADNLSQHKLCDDIASAISDFEDLVSEVEQSLSGNLPKGSIKPKKSTSVSLKPFVEDVISKSKEFLKDLEGMGENYVGIKSECETFIGNMQRNLYLVNFTMKEDLKRRLAMKLNEARPKNVTMDGDVDKLIGRKPKSIKARINQIYKIVKKYGIDSKVYHDEAWQAIDDYCKVISSLGCEVNVKPCGHIENADSMESDGGYCDYAEDGMPRSKQYHLSIEFEDGMKINGYIKCMAAGTMEDPFSAYDTCIVLWPKNNRVLENKMNNEIELTEGELKTLVKEATLKVLSENSLSYGDVESLYDVRDDYLDDPFNKPNSFDDDEWVDGDKDMENDYSWDRFDHKPIAQGLNDYYKVGKGAVPREVDDAINARNMKSDWSDKELRNGRRMMDKWVNGQRSTDDIDDAWYGVHEMKLTSDELHSLIRESVKIALGSMNEKIEIDPKNKGKFTATQHATGKSTEELTHSKNPLTRKRANFAKMAKRHWKPLKKSE